MSNRRVGLALVAMAGSAVGSYLLSRAYLRARAQCPPFRKRTYTHRRQLVDTFAHLWRHPEDLASLQRNPAMTPRLVKEIMLTVTGVNGCRYCSYAHAHTALRQGFAEEEVESLLRGEISAATAEEAPALVFAQQYAAQGGRPDEALLSDLVASYGQQTTQDILTSTRLVMMANLVGNTLDALVSRFLGKPSPETTLREELAILTIFCFSIAPLMPVLMIRALRTA